jgi:BlaI family transcriptional regulator, penicillinase repressor
MISNVGPLERKILNILWIKESATAREICTSLEKTGERRAYSTVRTIIKRLVKKNIIKEYEDSNERQFVYSPIMTKQELEKSIINKVLGDLLNKFEHSAINYLAEELSDNEEDIDKIKQKLSEMKKNAE